MCTYIAYIRTLQIRVSQTVSRGPIMGRCGTFSESRDILKHIFFIRIDYKL